MKNPWMSAWLSEYHKAAGAMQGQMMAEMTRQQKAMTEAWMKQATEAWVGLWFPWMKGR